MSEAELTAFQNIVLVLETLVHAGCLAYFIYPFMTGKKEPGRSKKKKAFIVFVTYSLIYLAGMIFSIWNWLCLLLVLVILAASSGFLDMDKKVCSLSVVLFYFLKSISGLITASLYFLFIEHFVWKETDIEVIFKYTAVVYSVDMLLQFCILTTMLFFLRRKMVKCRFELSVKEFCHLVVIPVVGILFTIVISRTFVSVQGNEAIWLFKQYPVFLGIIPLLAVLFYAGSLLTFMSYKEMVMLQREKKKYFVEEQQIHAMQERIHEVEQFYTGIRQIKHEMRNHLTNIKGLAEGGRYEEMEQYIAQMDAGLSAFELTVKTGNAVTDVIVNDKKKAADKLGVKFQLEFNYPLSEKYNAYDVGIILNNLLTNALEACEKMEGKERYITLSGRQKRKFFLIEVKNSFEGEIEFDANTDFPLSTKQNDTFRKFNSMHGIGLSNVKKEVEKYMGDMKIKVKQNEFSVTVLLQERSM
ncbi:MAG: GHKL domain-containing protein [Lachnospiraceae bacterium]|nr:GHKL domain-containing protein [Lachnospiraceae bacterium]